jgi:hypothetical protein
MRRPREPSARRPVEPLLGANPRDSLGPPGPDGSQIEPSLQRCRSSGAASRLLHRSPAAPTAHASRQPPGAGASPPRSPPAFSPARKEKNARRQLPWGAPWLCRRPLRQRRCEGGRGGPSGRRLGFPPSRPREGDARDESGTLHQLRLTRQLLICGPAARTPRPTHQE